MLGVVISLYKKTKEEIEASSSGKRRFHIIISYLEQCEKVFTSLPPFALLKDFLFVLIDIILNSDISFTDPAKLTVVKHILNDSRKEFSSSKGDGLILTQIEKAVDILNMQLLRVYFYTGKYEEGLSVLNTILKERDAYYSTEGVQLSEVPKTKPEARIKDKYMLVNPEIYKESKAYEILSEVKRELERLNSYSEDRINIMLVEHESSKVGYSSGTIQTLTCKTAKKADSGEGSVSFENITDLDDTDLKNTISIIGRVSNFTIRQISGKSAKAGIKRNIGFENIKGIYKGSSLGLGGAVISVCNYFGFMNSRKRYKVSNAAAFTGTIEGDGKIVRINTESIKDKIEAAFFSWIKYCVVPKENYNEAVATYERLKKHYPNKNLEIISAETVKEVFKHSGIIKTETLNSYQYSRLAIERNKIKSATIMIMLLIALVSFLTSKLLPKEIKPLPRTDAEMYLIYAPDRDTSWIFKNENYFGGDTINFGDVAIGDHWFPAIEFWNNGRKAEEFDVFIEGNDKEEFQTTWLYRSEQPDAPKNIREDISQVLYVKFVPTRNEGSKKASLIFENKRTKARKEIILKGISKRYNGGYCIDMGETDDLLLLEPNINLINSNTTISMWIKPYYIDTNVRGNILINENNPLTNNKLSIFSYGDGNIGIDVAGSKSRDVLANYIRTNLKLNKYQWNFLALILGDTTITVILNDRKAVYTAEKNYLRIMNDCIFSGIYRPSDRSVTYEAGIIYLKFFLDELKIYKKALTPEELIKNKHNTGYREDDALVHYTFEDATPKRIYDASSNDFWPRIYGGIRRVIDEDQPFKSKTTDSRENNERNTVFKTDGKGFLRLNKNIYETNSSFTFQCDFKVELDSINENYALAQPFFPNKPSLDISFRPGYDSIYVFLLNNYKDVLFKKGATAGNFKEWTRYTMCYDAPKNEFTFYLNGKEIFKKNDFFETDITKNYMGISFALINYFGSPRFVSRDGSAIDNLKLFNRTISGEEIYSDTKDGLIAFWTFEKTDRELAYDEIAGLPLLMVEPYDLNKEELNTEKR